MTHIDLEVVAQRDRVLDAVLELAHVARPVVAPKRIEAALADAPDLLPGAAGVLREEMHREQRDVVGTLAKRGHADVDHVESIEQVFAKPAFLDVREEVTVRGGDDPDVDRDRRIATDALIRPFLQNAEQLDLDRQRDLADLIEEQRAAVGPAKASISGGVGTGERALFVTEEFALEDALGERGTVYGDERPFAAWAGAVQGLCREFLARAAFAREQHGCWRVGDLVQQVEDVSRGFGLADPAEPGFLGLAFLAELFELPRSLAMGQQPFDDDQQLVEPDRLREVVVSSLLHRVDSALHGAVGGHHDHADLRVGLLHLRHQLRAVHARHMDVGDQKVWDRGFDQAEGLECVSGSTNLVALFTQELDETGAGAGFVVHDEDLGTSRGTLRHG